MNYEEQLIRLRTEEERLIIQKLKIEWQTSPMNFLSFEEWVLMNISRLPAEGSAKSVCVVCGTEDKTYGDGVRQYCNKCFPY